MITRKELVPYVPNYPNQKNDEPAICLDIKQPSVIISLIKFYYEPGTHKQYRSLKTALARYHEERRSSGERLRAGEGSRNLLWSTTGFKLPEDSLDQTLQRNEDGISTNYGVQRLALAEPSQGWKCEKRHRQSLQRYDKDADGVFTLQIVEEFFEREEKRRMAEYLQHKGYTG